jgi:hypothetical protein
MNNLQFEVTSKTKNNCVHLRVLDGKEDIGLLYLNSRQYSAMLQIIRTGCFNRDIDFSVIDPYVDSETDTTV